MKGRGSALLGAVMLVVLLGGGCARTVPGAAHLAAGAQPAPAPAAPASSAPPPLVLNAVIPGWSPVRSVKRAAVYDVPPGWQVLTEDTLIGFESPDGQPRVIASGASNFGEGACGSRNANLAEAAVTHDTSTDTVGAAQAVARAWADAGYRDDADKSPTVTLSAPQTITTVSGQPAVVVKAEAQLAGPNGSCGYSRGAAWAVAATGYHGQLGPTVILVITADEVDTGAQTVPEAQIRQILTTLRPEPT